MEVIRKANELKTLINSYKSQSKSIGFIPTMGALHKGHLDLVSQAVAENDISVCSIFINPVQFNEQSDFENYPKTEDEDLELLKAENVDIVFIPTYEEVYPDGAPKENYSFDGLENVMEGKNRPGHFNGVAAVVKRLFQIVQPDKAYFGKKDYQQYLIIQKLVEKESMDIEIVPCQIVREESGLAMSSRNKRLSDSQLEKAPFIYQILQKAVNAKKYMNPVEISNWIEKQFDDIDGMELEYFKIADGFKLEDVQVWNASSKPMGFIVVKLGDVRLIDNIEFYSSKS